MAKKSYPKVIYVDLDREADGFYAAHDDPSELVLHSGTKRVGCYELTHEVVLRNTTTVEAAPKPKAKKGRRR